MADQDNRTFSNGMRTRFDPPVRIEMLPGDEDIEFSTLDELHAWAQREHDTWDVLNRHKGSMPGDGDEAISVQTKFLDHLLVSTSQGLQLGLNRISAEAADKGFEWLVAFNNFSKGYSQGDVVYSRGVAGQKILAALQTSPEFGIGLLASYVRVPKDIIRAGRLPQTVSKKYVRAIIDNELSIRGLDSADTIKRAAEDINRGNLEKYLSDRTKNLEREVDELNDLRLDLDKLKTSLQRTIESSENRLQEFFSSAERAQTKVMSLEAELERLRNAYSTRVQSNAAVEFWEDKGQAHTSQAAESRSYLQLFVGVSCAVIVALLADFGPNVLDAKLWSLTLVAGSSAVLVWVGRVLVRLFLTQISLGEDAAERATMTKTFIAMVRDGGVTPEQAGLVLHAMFRPFGSTDDAGLSPLLPQEAIIRSFMGKSD